MSNLNLPTMTYTNLSHVLGGRPHKQIGYATTLERVNGAVYVKHHASVIAVLEPDSVYITNAGWESSTTTNRLSKILRDNSIPFRVYIKQFAQYIAQIGANGDGINPVPFRDATFTRTAAGWINAEESVSA